MSDAKTSATAEADQRRGLKQLMADYERELILETLEKTAWNQRRAARALGVLPTTLSEKMKRLGIRSRRLGTDHPS